QNHPGDALVLERDRSSSGNKIGRTVTPSGHHGGRVAGLEAGEGRDVRTEEPAYLLGDSGEDLRRRGLSGNERRHAPQRGLLLGESPYLRPRLRIGDGRGDELREGCEP